MRDADIRKAADLLERGQARAAVPLARTALVLDPADAAALQLTGAVSASTADPAAVSWFARVAMLLPDSPVPLAAQAGAFFDLGRLADARRMLRRALALSPSQADQAVLLADVVGGGALSEAWLARALAVAPDHAAAAANLAVLLRRRGALAAAERAARRAAAWSPSVPQLLVTFAILALKRRDPTSAECWSDRCLAIRGDSAEGRWNRAFARLLAGRLEEGWHDAEARWRLLRQAPRPHPTAPRWRGEDIAGGRLLLQAEQGLGDTIQFSRYAALAAQRGAVVTLAVPRPLQRLMRTAPGVDAVIVGDGSDFRCDWQCPLMSLPLVFRTSMETIPAAVPYLSADPSGSLAWLPKAAGTLRVGLSWRGNPANHDDTERSLRTELLEPLMRVAGVEFVALRSEGDALPGRWPIVDAAPHVGDLADTAAVIRDLDLVIACDSAVAHLSGALGHPTWTLLGFAADWRWLLGRDTSPWYPSMRLFRQHRFGDWSRVVAEVAAKLEQWVETARIGSRGKS